VHYSTPECVHRQYIEAIWEEAFEEVIFSSSIIKTPQEMEQKKKLQEPIQIKGKLTFCEGKDNSTSKILFVVISFSPPPSYHFKNPFQIHWESFLNSFQSIL
jgi:hypothetical protein